MAKRLYSCGLIGDGSPDNPYRGEVDCSRMRRIGDFRTNRSAASGKALYLCDTTPSQHAAAIASPGVKYIPIEDAQGNTLGGSSLVSDIDSAKRAQMVSFLEQQGVPTDGISANDTIRSALQVVLMRGQLASFLGVDDFGLDMDAAISSIPAARRSRIAAKLTAAGFTIPSPLTTVRQFIQDLRQQPGWPSLREEDLQ